MNNEKETIDWERLKKALLVEAGRGLQNIQGKQYIFNDFLSISLSKPPVTLKAHQNKFQEFSKKFASYPEMTREERQDLLEKTHNFLNKMQSLCVMGKEESRLEINSLEMTAKRQKNNSIFSQKNTNNLKLEQILKDVEGIGIKNSERLETLGLHTVRELLYYYPRDHIDYARQVNIRDLEPGETVTIIGKIKRFNCFSSPKNKKLTILEITLVDATGQIKITRFFAGSRFSNKGWQMLQKKIYPVGAIVAVSGLVKQNQYGKNLDNPEIEVLDSEGCQIESMKIGRLVPVYPLTEGVGADVVRLAILKVLPTAEQLSETLPENFLNQYQLIDLKNAIRNIHFPIDKDCLAAARRRLVFDEFFYLQLGLLKRRQLQKKTETGIALPVTGKLIEQFYTLLPFQLTNAQKRVVNEILRDLQKPEPMKRLVQGDVGAGKTVVAVVAILAAIQVGYQAALMAPTEVLAEQHYHKLVTWFNLLHLPVELLTGSTKIAKRREIYSQLETGELPILVGTHALIQDTVNFHKLGLVVIDEQHRFGVQQRAKLQQKGESPHFLAMTATPIPRTLALTLHGDLDVSQIDELPPGRQPIQTTNLTGRQRKKAYDLIRREIVQGRQVYVVLPLVEESEKLDVKSAIEEHQKLAEKVFPEFQIGLLHGRMSGAEKDQAISTFRDNQTQILVSTTVVEVGVDVPNATVMLIENAERFGLSQLHQLRGRVGRGAHRSYCLLMRGAGSTDATERLKVLEQSQDGFFIAEMDMRLRGPGQVLGTKQSGLPDFALASLVEDQEVLELARGAALQVMEEDESLNSWPVLRRELEWRYQKMMGGSILN